MDKSRLRIAMQKSGRLSKESQILLEQCGIKINLQQQRLWAFVKNLPIDIDIMRVRDDDIPGLVMDGIVDLGIVGENVLEEKLLTRKAQGEEYHYVTLRRLDFGNCRLSIAIPFDNGWISPKCLQHKRIATAYPYLLKKYLDELGITFKLCLLHGSVEVAPRAGLADAICDLVSSGSTLEANGLKEVEVIYRSKACLIQRNGILSTTKKALVNKMLLRIQGIIQAREAKYIMLNAPIEKINSIINLLPGTEQPTVIPLAGNSNRVAIHIVSSENIFWKTIENLKILGAKSILVLPIEKIIE